MLKKVVLFSLLFIIAGNFFANRVRATSDLSWAKNKFGIHLLDNPNDIISASKLLNTHGGDWGWVVLVLRDNDLNTQKWQNIFNLCRRYHLLPLIRLATHAQGRVWAKPNPSDITSQAKFLNNLLWPTGERFIIIFNEPNRGDEWGGQASPQEYASILQQTIQIFHAQAKKFFLISGGLDLAAPNKPPAYYSAEIFYRQILIADPDVFEALDGLASHSYPNHGFRGSPNDWGKTSIHGYIWELNYLRSLGVKKQLPVFITETGWPHRQGQKYNSTFLPNYLITQYLTKAVRGWLADTRIVMFSPFLLHYSLSPLDHFSWQKDNGDLYRYAKVFLKWPKSINSPFQLIRAKIISERIPFFLAPGEESRGKLLLENEGQNIWGGKENRYCFKSDNGLGNQLCAVLSSPLEPGGKAWFTFSFSAPRQTSQHLFRWKGVQSGVDHHFFIFPKRYLMAYLCSPGLNKMAYLISDLRRYLKHFSCKTKEVLLK